MSIVSHSDIILSFYEYIHSNLELVFNYTMNYGESDFDVDLYDLWLSPIVEEVGAGVKEASLIRLDVFTRIVPNSNNDAEITAIDRIRDVFTNSRISLFNYSSGSPVFVSDEKLIVLNTKGRRTVERVVLDNLQNSKLQQNLRKSSVFFRLMLLTDIVKGRFV